MKIISSLLKTLFLERFVRSAHRGQSLIEVLVVLGLLGIVLTAVTVMINASVNNAQFTRNQNLATKYAQEAMEVVRAVRNQNYAGFTAYSGTYCLDKGQITLGTAVGSCTFSNIDNIFIRSVRITQNSCSPQVARIIATVSWTDGKCSAGTYCHEQEHESCISTLNPIQAP